MSYNDFQLPGQMQFEEMAKEYTKRLNVNEEKNLELIDSAGYHFTYLLWLYNFICKNLFHVKAKRKFKKLEENVLESFENFKEEFNSYNFNGYELKQVKITSLSNAIKVAVITETNLIESLINLGTPAFALSALNRVKSLVT